MREVPPCTVSNFSPFSTYPYPLVLNGDSENVFSHASRDGTWCWIAQGAVIEVFSLQTKERCAFFCFGAKLRDSTLTITAVEELCSPHITFPCLLVGLDTISEGGLLCIFNVKTSKVISAINLPYKITSLEVVSGTGGATMETYALNSHLRFLFGIAAVGTEGGHIILVDLCLDAEIFSDETSPNKGHLLRKFPNNIPQQREYAIAGNQPLCFALNENSFSSDSFQYRNKHKVLASFCSEDVIVSALKYVRSLALLIVGFNFGGIQLWNLQQLALEFSVAIHQSRLPVVHFAFQEPENDPRNVCYMWAVSGHYQGENYRPETTSIAILYSLAYTRKEWIPRFGYFYKDFCNCCKRFEFSFSNDLFAPVFHNNRHCSRLIACDVISQSDSMNRLEADDSLQSDEWSASEDLSLCLIAWENWLVAEDKPSSSYLVVFDLNQWYQAQMPSFLRYNSGDICSYVGVFCLREVMRKMDNDSLLAIAVVPSTVGRFRNTSTAEEFFFPSALSFKVCCVTAEGILYATYLGAQRQLLSHINISGPGILIQPKELYKQCLVNGLLHHITDSIAVKQMPLSRQRETLLTLALENNMVQFLVACAQQWRGTEFIRSGCTTKFLLEWLWKRVTQIKTSVDKLCQPLFNCSGQVPDESLLLTVHNYKTQLKHLSDILNAFQNAAGPHTEQGQHELQLRKEVLDSIYTYLHVIIWLYDCKLLPEHAEGEEYGEDEVAYPVSLLSRTYMFRRNELHKIHSSVRENEILLVDGLVSEFGDALGTMWESKGGSCTYPPPSLYAAVSSYLIDGVPLYKKHMLLQYLLLDLSAYLADRQSHLLEKLMTFPSVNNLSASVSKLTQSFWHLDHRDFETALAILTDPMIFNSDITSQQHVRILKTLLFQGQIQQALKYINVRSPPESSDEEVKLHLSVLLANGLIADAFSYQREHQNDDNIDDLLGHIFLGCQQTHSLDILLQLPLNTVECVALSKYLHNCVDPQAPELLVLLHLLRSQPLEAADLNEKLSTRVMGISTKSQENASARNALVSGFLDTLPEEQKRLAQELSHIYSHAEKRQVSSCPLSATLTSSSLTCISYSDLLRKVMEKLADSNYETSMEAYTPFRSWKPSISTTPFLRSPFTPRSKKRKRDAGDLTPESRKSSADPGEGNEFYTPVKRSKLFEVSSFTLTDADQQRAKSHIRNEFLSLLQTPPVCRKSSRAQSPKSSESASEITPLSILKTKTSITRAFSPVLEERLYQKTPSVYSEASRDEEMSEKSMEQSLKTPESSRLRQLRFQVPSPENVTKETTKVSIHQSHREEKKVSQESAESEGSRLVLKNAVVNMQQTVPTLHTATQFCLPRHSDFLVHYSDSEASLGDAPVEDRPEKCTFSEREDRVEASDAGSSSINNMKSHSNKSEATSDEEEGGRESPEEVYLDSESNLSSKSSKSQGRGKDDVDQVCDIDSKTTSEGVVDPDDKVEDVVSEVLHTCKDKVLSTASVFSSETVENPLRVVPRTFSPVVIYSSEKPEYFESQIYECIDDAKQQQDPDAGVWEDYEGDVRQPLMLKSDLSSRSSSPSKQSEVKKSQSGSEDPDANEEGEDSHISEYMDACEPEEPDANRESLEKEQVDISVHSSMVVTRSRARSSSKSPSRSEAKPCETPTKSVPSGHHTEPSEKQHNKAEPTIAEHTQDAMEYQDDDATVQPTITTRARSQSKSPSRRLRSSRRTSSSSSYILPDSILEVEDQKGTEGSDDAFSNIHTDVKDNAQIKGQENLVKPPSVTTRSRSQSKSPSRSSRKSQKKPVNNQMMAKLIEQGDEEEVPIQSSEKVALPKTPEKQPEEEVQDTSPYLNTRSRSRSKSISPSRVLHKSSPKKSLPKKDVLPATVINRAEDSGDANVLLEVLEKVPSSRQVPKSVKRISRPKSIPEPVPEAPDDTNESVCKTEEKSSLIPVSLEAKHTEEKSESAAQKIVTPVTSSETIEVTSVQTKSKSKDPEQFKTSISVTGKTIRKKGKGKKGPVFTFSEPHSPASPQILEALSASPATSVPPFVFSPPTTRTRVRKKKKESLLDASVSFADHSESASYFKKTTLEKDKSAKPMKFTFSEPDSPASPEVLEALSVSTASPVPPFVFSPPTTRARVRRKKDESLEVSAISAHDESVCSTKVSIDPLLEGDAIGDLTKSMLAESSTPSYSTRKQSTKTKRNSKQPKLSDSEDAINFISPFAVSSGSSKTSQSSRSARHVMVLRKSRSKKKSVKLF